MPFRGFYRSTPMLNALTVDVEDYFQVSAFEHRISRSEWEQRESRVEANTHRLLALFEEHGVKGTFFVLGWVAERFPSLVREIDARGHEIGSHSYWHRLIYTLTIEEFRADLKRSKDVLENLIGRSVTLYRAPSFSITAQSTWALDVLVDEGFQVDSSVFPVRHDRYGMRNAPRAPHLHEMPGGPLLEFPPATLTVAGCRLPIGGGGYFRLLPLAVTSHAVQKVNRTGCPFMFYIHPWEVDPQQPRVEGVGRRSQFRHYVNLARTEAKLRRLLERFSFGTLSQSLQQGASEVVAAFSKGRERSANGERPNATLQKSLQNRVAATRC
jgi:polysaccharide deacetylase family protein (PEP-CTERM system associated)